MYILSKDYGKLFDLLCADNSEAIFQCAWCQEANRADRDCNAKNGASIELTEYIFPVQMIGGYDEISNLPICENCADAAAEELTK